MIHYYSYLFVKKKVFNYSGLPFSEMTSYKIHTLVVALLLWNQVVVDDLQFLCLGLLAGNVDLLVELLANLIRVFLYLDIVGVAIPIYVGGSLL